MMELNYPALCRELEALTEGIPYPTANLANAAALLFERLENINWAGFYLMQDGQLVLGPFQGRPACTLIAVGRGVCGTAVAENAVQRVPDVHLVPGHIACDSASASELVIPLRRDGQVVGVLDIDSPILNRFSPDDQAGLEAFAAIVEKML